jgi:peptidoglycan hydrolase-like protein with peptidoglycan-binding domain
MSTTTTHARAPRRALRRVAGVALAGAAVTAGGLVTAQSAQADTVWDRVAQCESGGDWSINTGNGFYGGLQFTYQTWAGYGGQKYAQTANLATKAQQIEIAQKVLASQGPGAWPVCSVEAGLTGGNGGAVSTNPAPARTTTTSRSAERSGDLAVDGIRGPHTNTAIERWVGGSTNGSLSGSDVRALQNKLGVTADGIIGPVTTRALQQVVGTQVDGIWGPLTTTALQRHLNATL